ncbi:MAG: hypothetical protein DMD71_01000 [Gemmatimonadetes bacterium]|nr:MAG: hypothetical protein DMD71_01000 [Gemmatimonadota bacterium]
MLPRAQINVTPMIDVMLVLLIIFMIVAPVINARVTLPRSRHADSRPEEPGEITLYIERNGDYSLSTTGAGTGTGTSIAVPADGLGDRLRALYDHRARDRVLYLKADAELRFGRVQQAVEIARRSGVRVVAAVTEQRSTAAGSSRRSR